MYAHLLSVRDPGFVGETAQCIGRFKPGLTIINSVVGLGKTRSVVGRTGTIVVHSPVRGNDRAPSHTKFVRALEPAAPRKLPRISSLAGFKTKSFGFRSNRDDL